MKEQTIHPIAYIESDYKEKFGIPRQSGLVPESRARIVFLPPYRTPDALRGIEGFSHLWLLFDFSLAHRECFSPTVRPPRLGGNTHVGVFASRSPFRPNHIGLSSVRLVGVEHTDDRGDTLVVSGADLLDGTPIYDVKPYLPFTDCHPDATQGYSADPTPRLDVLFPDDLLSLLPEKCRAAASAALAQDPRPSYQEDPERTYIMKFANSDLHFKVKNGVLTVVDVVVL